jgi:hypothetical protein
MSLDHRHPVLLEILQPGDEAVIVAGHDHVHVVQVRRGEIEVLLAVRRARHREDDVELLFAQLVLDRAEIRQLAHLEAGAELVADDVEVIGDDTDETAAAILEFVGRIVGFRAHADDGMRHQPFFLLGCEVDERGRAGRLRGRNDAQRDASRRQAGRCDPCNQPALARPQYCHWHP